MSSHIDRVKGAAPPFEQKCFYTDDDDDDDDTILIHVYVMENRQ